MGLGSVALIGWVAVRGDLGLLTSMDSGQLGWVLLTGVLLAGYVGTWFAALQRARAVDVTAVLVLAVPITAALDAVIHGTPLGSAAGLAGDCCSPGAPWSLCWAGGARGGRCPLAG